MARKRPTEVRGIISLLEQDWDDVADLAEAIIEKLDELRARRTQYTYWMCDPNPQVAIISAYGPYDTANQAEKESKKLVSAGPKLSFGGVLQLRQVAE